MTMSSVNSNTSTRSPSNGAPRASDSQHENAANKCVANAKAWTSQYYPLFCNASAYTAKLSFIFPVPLKEKVKLSF